MTGSNQVNVEIVVQPPPTVGVNRWLVPPVVARTRDAQLVEDYLNGAKHVFATATLYASNMDDYSSALGGNWNVSAQLVTENAAPSRGGGSSSRSANQQWLYFIFNPVSVAMEGMFAFNVVISALSLSSPAQAGVSQVVGGRATRQFNVLAQPPRVERPNVIGRRGINFLGNFIVIVAALLQGLAPNLACLMVGRFLLGFGSSMASAPQYMAEVSPVHLRGRLVGFFGTWFQVGSLIISGAMVGFAKWTTSDYQWRIPLLFEAFFPLLVCITIFWWCPESPRYLILKGRREEARRVVAKYMTTNNDINAPIVPLVMQQMETSLESSQATRRAAWDYRVFFTKPVRFRTLVLVMYSCCQQWNGGAIISYYLSPALETIGVTKEIDQLGINLGSTCTYFVFEFLGSFLVDIFRRRTLIITGLITFIVTQTAVTITSWQYSLHEAHSAAVVTIVLVFIYQMCSASLIATMHNLYPVEILSLRLRAKGMGFYNMIQGAAGVVQNYGIAVGISKVGYKIWVVYIVYNTMQLVVAYFLFPETSKLSLEEIDAIFETPGTNPVSLSKKISRAKTDREKLDRQALRDRGA